MRVTVVLQHMPTKLDVLQPLVVNLKLVHNLNFTTLGYVSSVFLYFSYSFSFIDLPCAFCFVGMSEDLPYAYRL